MNIQDAPSKAAPAKSVQRPIRVVTSTSLFDGHDAAINVMRRIMQDLGAEVIHLGHNRSVEEVVQAVIQEDVAAVAVSAYQGGHVEYFKYLVDRLKEEGAGHVKIFGGGGGVIVPREIEELQRYGVERIYSPEDGRQLGLVGMLEDLMARAAGGLQHAQWCGHETLSDARSLARTVTALEDTYSPDAKGELAEEKAGFLAALPDRGTPVIGVTGTGGAGKSSLVDELVNRFLRDFEDLRVAVVSVDPTRRKTGGALLGDRIRMNAVFSPRVFMRSLATRERHGEISQALGDVIRLLKASDFDLVIAETAGIGQGDAGIVPLVDLSLYVMTAEFGAASQLEKIDMIDFADFVAVNKFDRAGSEDALRDVCKQMQRNRHAFDQTPDTMPAYGTIAARFNDDGVTALYHGLLDALNARMETQWESSLTRSAVRHSTNSQAPIPGDRVRYLAEIAETVRGYHAWAGEQSALARQVWQLDGAAGLVDDPAAAESIRAARERLAAGLDRECAALLDEFPKLREDYARDEYVYKVRDREFRVPLYYESLAGTRVPRVALPRFEDPGQTLAWLLRENIPGRFPFTGGVFPFRRAEETATRMFAGEGTAKRTNERFHYLAAESPAKRLSTAFDSVTLYGEDPDPRPDIFGKVGTSGASICCLDDMKQVYEGFDLSAPSTSVSMTINGPAPAILAMFMNTAIDQALDRFESDQGRKPDAEESARIRAEVLNKVRGTVQADVLKEDQGQNTCIFAIDFALRMQGDIQEFFIANKVRNFYSVSISGYHIAEAGANPISQLAFTLSNGFTFIEHYLSRGMHIDDFAPNLSFFFSCGMDPEYSVLIRVARRIWAVAMRERYGANSRSQQLKTHIQTSGRSLHAQEIAFNDIRTTLEALSAWYDQCNSLHTNAYDEAVTTPTEESVRRALAIQQIINKEFGLAQNENPLQGSFVVEELTDLVEEAVLKEFESINARGGVLGAMERGYQRSRIQEESHRYEYLKSTGAYPIVGVNTFVDPKADHNAVISGLELRRGTDEDKERQLENVAAFRERNKDKAPEALRRLQQVCREGGNTFAELMETVRVCTLGQITHALFEVGGQYRRNT